MPSAIGEDVEALAGERAGVGFARGDSQAGGAERLADSQLREIGRGEAAVRFHAEEHGNGFVDGKITEPVVRAAPGGERCDGERECGRHAAAEVAEKTSVKGSLGTARVEVNLQGGDGGIGGGDVEDESCGGALQAGGDLAGSLDADDGDAFDSWGINEGLAAWDDSGRMAKEDGAVESGDGGGAWINVAEVFATLPDPEGAGGEQVHAASGRREVKGIRLETEAAEEERDEAQRLASVHFGGRDLGWTESGGRSRMKTQVKHGIGKQGRR